MYNLLKYFLLIDKLISPQLMLFHGALSVIFNSLRLMIFLKRNALIYKNVYDKEELANQIGVR